MNAHLRVTVAPDGKWKVEYCEGGRTSVESQGAALGQFEGEAAASAAVAAYIEKRKAKVQFEADTIRYEVEL